MKRDTLPPNPIFTKSVRPLIEAQLANYTKNERIIAQYFLKTASCDDDFSSKEVAKRLGVSEAALTRFAQKLEFRGFRELVYAYQRPAVSNEDQALVEPVLLSYQEILNKTYSIVDMAQIHRITQLLLDKSRVYIYGKGSSGLVAQEMKLRFMRIGLVCEAITDDDIMRMNAVVVDSSCVVMGVSVSGKTRIVLESLQNAHEQGASSVLFTGYAMPEFRASFDEVVLFSLKNQMEHGRMISPQFPALVVLDMLYADYMNTHKEERDQIWQRTYQALQLNKESS
ncbi:MAG: MurR/RpiR family transcriptional regulator [Cardiobacteriaceae bacterium]|nr:MurR/RpiR family transcriptional regulator [Cardiobacteriaceae bacterium]